MTAGEGKVLYRCGRDLTPADLLELEMYLNEKAAMVRLGVHGEILVGLRFHLEAPTSAGVKLASDKEG